MACSAAVKSAAPGRLMRPSEAASTAQSAGGAVAIALVSASMACPGNTLAALAAATAAACRTPASASASNGMICPISAGDSNRPIARTAWARTRGFCVLEALGEEGHRVGAEIARVFGAQDARRQRGLRRRR